MEQGKHTSEFWMAAVGKVIAVVFPLLVAYGVLDTEKGELWAGLILAVASVVIPIVVGSIDKRYVESRTALKRSMLEQATASMHLEATRLESLERN